ncbi:hypothetical protein P691DRAFT_728201 [Macrolepiota fuliginosa MF-IS2]|uniref:Uncharacterized protein n=1 Tax=Macrolepiota fuliginosa MF-IS2 TaxID=1400762 RepID=A0A9P5XDY1_9AGAR|nr:hypothetical protein P691DRAFT_728201 [Macrolepiota fuliginosa MF-IS2]
MLSLIIRNPRSRRNVLYVLALLAVVYLACTETALLGYDRSPTLTLTTPNSGPQTSSVLPPTTLAGEPRDPRILLVSALFPLAKSKHTHAEYEDWLSRFLGSITTPVYFYAPPSFASTVLSARGSLPIYINTTFESPFDVPPLQGLQPAYEHIRTLDREAFRHNPELYAVWNAKPWLLDNAVRYLREERGEVYDYAFWNDAGSFRSDHHYTRWPDPKRVEEVWKTGATHTGAEEKQKDELLFFPLTGTFSWLKRYWREDDGPVDAEISEGSFFGGSSETVAWWSKVYYVYHDYYLRNGYFVGKDQTLINSLFLLFPSRIIGTWIGDPSARTGVSRFDSGPLGACGNPWFYYQFFLASEIDREKMQEQWMRELEDRTEWPWKGWRWWLQRQGCKLTRVVWMRDMLWDAFGKGWGVKNMIDVN